ncbi:MAG TPA: HAD hydrolase family protein, partial [Burkholderiaceae bacterium]|nr:HAD hydrolase family protein [Burkholderiaceae bacterium]
RAADLRIEHVLQGVHEKRAGFEQLMAQTSVQALECGFVGDDLIDLPVLSRVGFAASVPNGHAEVRARVHFVTQAAGGNGAVRELCDFILQAQGNYQAALAPYLG